MSTNLNSQPKDIIIFSKPEFGPHSWSPALERQRQWTRLINYTLLESKIALSGESLSDSDNSDSVPYDEQLNQIRKYKETVREIATRVLEDIDYEDLLESQLAGSGYLSGAMAVEQTRITTIETEDGRLEPAMVIILIESSRHKSLKHDLPLGGNPRSDWRREGFVRKSRRRLARDIKHGRFDLIVKIMPILPEKIDGCVVTKGGSGQTYFGDIGSGSTFVFLETKNTDGGYDQLGKKLTPKDSIKTTETMLELESIAEIVALSEKA